MSTLRYLETVWSELYPGNRHTIHCLQPAVLATESVLDLAAAQRKRTVWRVDAGAGMDAPLRWLLSRGYAILAKGHSNPRAKALARQVQRWDPYGDAWVGEVAPPIDYGAPVRVFVKRRWKNEQYLHSYYVSSLRLSSKRQHLSYYDARGGAEVEQFRNDKSGLHMAARRKRSFAGQKALILLTDLCHNLLADFQRRALVDSRFAGYGPLRIVRDLFMTPGRLIFENGQLRKVELLSLKQIAPDLLTCLEKYLLT